MYTKIKTNFGYYISGYTIKYPKNKSKGENNLVELRRSEYKMARQMGFEPKNKVTSSVNRKHYYVSDYDYAKFLQTLQKNTTESVR